MIYLLYTVHILICLFLILVVLLQQGKGADLSVFGGGGTMTAFGARGAATLLHKMTVVGFVGFIVTTLVIGILQKQGGASSVMSDIPTAEAAAAAAADEATETEAADEVVGAFAEDEPEAEAGAAAADEPVEGDAATSEEPGTEGGDSQP